MRCTQCSTDTSIGNYCNNCNTEYAKNFCSKCFVWCSKVDFYHCDKCGNCKRGNKDDFYHCDECNVCLSFKCKDIHNCKAFKNKNENCPMCHEVLFKPNSTEKIKLLLCNHMMHMSCYDKLISSTEKQKKVPTCLLCNIFIVRNIFCDSFSLLIKYII